MIIIIIMIYIVLFASLTLFSIYVKILKLRRRLNKGQD